ncbi:hypothetical protein QYF61_020647, partial [Mycteria americana]
MYKTSDARCNCSPPADRCPACAQAAIAAPRPTLPGLYTEHDVIWILQDLSGNTGKEATTSPIPVIQDSVVTAAHVQRASWNPKPSPLGTCPVLPRLIRLQCLKPLSSLQGATYNERNLERPRFQAVIGGK